MRKLADTVLAYAPVAHVMRAATRFGERSGPLFAAAVTYFSVLSLVPILMLTFSLTGILITTFRPDLLVAAKDVVFAQLGDGSQDSSLRVLINTVFTGFGGVEVVLSLAIALWTGSGWIGNLRKSVESQVAEDPSALGPRRNFIMATLANMLTFLVLVLLVIVTFTVTTLATSFNEQVIAWLGIGSTPGMSLLVGATALALTAAAGTVLFLYLFWVLAPSALPAREWLLGSMGAGIGLMALQSLAGLVTGMFATNMTAKIFGPVIVLMLFFNLFATLVMFMAAWIGTAEPRTDPGAATKPVLPPASLEPEPLRVGPWPARACGQLLTEKDLDDPDAALLRPDPTILVPQDVAARGVRVGTAVGYGLGALTGAGVGALFAVMTKGLLRRHS